jgi:hypothetical protein
MKQDRYEIDEFDKQEEINLILKGIIKDDNYPYNGEPYFEYSVYFIGFHGNHSTRGEVIKINSIRKGIIPGNEEKVGYHGLKNNGRPDLCHFFELQSIKNIKSVKEYYFDKKLEKRTGKKPKKKTLEIFFKTKTETEA